MATYDRTDSTSGRCRTSVLGAQLGDHVLSHVGALLGIFQLLLYLAEFGQVQGSDLFLKSQKERTFVHSSVVRVKIYFDCK